VRVRTPSNIRQKLKQVKYRHLQKLLKKRLAGHPANCLHNAEVAVPDNGTPHDPLHICGYKGETEFDGFGSVCDAKHGGVEKASACPCFQPRKSKDEIKAEFKDFFDTGTHGEVAYIYPDVAALMWTLDGDFEDDEDTEEEPVIEPAAELPSAPSQATVEALDPESETPPEGLLLEQVRELLVSEIEQAAGVLRAAVDELTGKFDGLPSKEDRVAEIRQVVESLQPPAPPAAPTSWWSRMFGAS
jgi:hypothetical protein